MYSEQFIDEKVIEIAKTYRRRLAIATDQYKDSPMRAGTKAQEDWLKDIRRHGLNAWSEPRTGVNGMGGGLTRFDAFFRMGGYDVWIEVQASASENKGERKQIQEQGQILGFAEVASQITRPALLYKIIRSPSEIRVWSRAASQGGVERGDYNPQRT